MIDSLRSSQRPRWSSPWPRIRYSNKRPPVESASSWLRTCYLNPHLRLLMDSAHQAQRPRWFHLDKKYIWYLSSCSRPLVDLVAQAQRPDGSILIENILPQPSLVQDHSKFSGSSLNTLITPQWVHEREQAVKPSFRTTFELIGSSSQALMVLPWSRTRNPIPWSRLK